MTNIFNYTLAELEKTLIESGYKKFNATQIFEWIYDKYELNFDKMSNLSNDLRKYLQKNFTNETFEELVNQTSSDGTIKILFKLSDNKTIETVLMPQQYGNTICITTQVGCNMACTFCASGLIKKQRNLDVSEIVRQVWIMNNMLKNTNETNSDLTRISNVVVMGIGEPFDNYDNVMKALDILNNAKALAIGSRHITVSTCGVIPKIMEFSERKMQINLAISLHAPNNEIRSEIMPINKAFPLEKLMQAVDYYLAKTNRRVTFEYILIDKVNDSNENARELAELIKGKNGYVNLIPYNEINENTYKRSKNIDNFFRILKKSGINAVVRHEYGLDIDAACGQLRVKREGVLNNAF
ncbi:23S rRNA (adenine(2503)-C(2))-methyltransferase RlmN [Spiroplasma endosymbiont of Labia minor]|uniref:23S rRNA (adenine(2503)-C(2))-methyltransferase RlmN n=1 Tax=Spiroplasma endosymbiont of Labia minor TaxID=3066305 RepID=UPI0030D5C961